MQLRISSGSSLLSSCPFSPSNKLHCLFCRTSVSDCSLRSEHRNLLLWDASEKQPCDHRSLHVRRHCHVASGCFLSKTPTSRKSVSFHKFDFENACKHCTTRSPHNPLSRSIPTTHYYCTLLDLPYTYSTFLRWSVQTTYFRRCCLGGWALLMIGNFGCTSTLKELA